MLRVLLSKDLRRARRNPLPWVINLVIPLLMTALIGLAFGGRSNDQALGRIRFAVVDEDRSILSEFLRGAIQNRDSAQHLDPVFMDREAALRVINENKISAVVIIPTNFMRNYLLGESNLKLELIKNPAEAVHPAVIEEVLEIAVAALSAISRNLNSEFPAWREVIDGKGDYRQVAVLIERAGAKLEKVQKFIDPPLVGYQKSNANESPETAPIAGQTNSAQGGKPAAAAQSRKDSNNPIFAFLLLGMSAMFLLFIASTAMVDLHREVRGRTFERFQTLNARASPFITGKVVFAVVMLLLSSWFMLWGGGWLFGIDWRSPVLVAVLTLGYAVFCASLFALLTSLLPDERSAGALNSVAGMVLGIAGGCAFPLQQMPGFLRNHISPLLPTNWYVQAARGLQFGDPVPVGWVLIKLLLLSAVVIALAGFFFQRRMRRGGLSA